jgi:hypothetical protein
MQRTVLNQHRRNKSNQSPALLPNQVQVHPTRSPGLQLSKYIYIPCDSNMIIVTIIITTIYFLSLASDRKSLDFYRNPIAYPATRSYYTSKTHRKGYICASGFHSTPLNLMHKHKLRCRIIGVMHRGLPGYYLTKVSTPPW